LQSPELFLLAGEDRAGSLIVTVNNPFDGTVIRQVYSASADNASHACASAKRAFDQTRKLSSWERSAILNRIADTLVEQSAFVANLIMLEAGKPLTDARNEVSRGIQTFRIAADEAKRIGGDITPADWTPGNDGRLALSRRWPIGPILGITPFNFPLNLVAHKVAPALASGNPIIIKPAPQTPMTALWLGRAVCDAGWPAGGISVLPCSNEVTAQMVADDRIAMLSFTGSASIGWMLRKQSATPRVTLELGGNAAVILCEDADLAKAISKIVAGGYSYAGQSCISVQRVFVHEALKSKLIEGLVDGLRKLTIGNPAAESTQLGPMINEVAAIRAESWITEAVKRGATLHIGGRRNGSLLDPALLSDVPPDAQLQCEEVFAPITVIEGFADFGEAIAAVNRSKYGLQAAVFTDSWRHIARAWEELEVGAVLVDESTAWRADHLPYGGVKYSGIGKEGVRSAILEMTEPRLLILPVG